MIVGRGDGVRDRWVGALWVGALLHATKLHVAAGAGGGIVGGRFAARHQVA